MKVVNLKQRTPEWLSWRKNGIGGSDIGSIVGKNPYRSKLDVYNDKKGLSSEQPQNEAMARGNEFENAVLEEMRQWSTFNYQAGICGEHEVHPFIRFSFDGYDFETKEVLEIKVPTARNFERYLKGDIPEYYNYQVQWGIKACEGNKAILSARSPEQNVTHPIRIYRDDKMISEAVEAAEQFWNDHILTDTPPSGGSCTHICVHDEANKHLAQEWIFLDIQEKEITGRTKDTLKGIKERKDRLKREIIDLGDDGNFIFYGIKCTRTKDSVTYDFEAMQKDGIDIEKYSTIKVGHYMLTREVE